MVRKMEMFLNEFPPFSGERVIISCAKDWAIIRVWTVIGWHSGVIANVLGTCLKYSMNISAICSGSFDIVANDVFVCRKFGEFEHSLSSRQEFGCSCVSESLDERMETVLSTLQKFLTAIDKDLIGRE